jgi:hypothetical protein
VHAFDKYSRDERQRTPDKVLSLVPAQFCAEGLFGITKGPSDAHESSILAEVLGLASIFLPRNRLALLEPYSINSPSPATHFPLCHGFLRPSTTLASPREAAALPDDPRLASCSTRRLVCITDEGHDRVRGGGHEKAGKIFAGRRVSGVQGCLERVIESGCIFTVSDTVRLDGSNTANVVSV